MGMGTTGIPRFPLDSHGNGSYGECVVGMGVGQRHGNGNNIKRIGMISHCICPPLDINE